MGTATGGDGYSFGRWRLLPEAGDFWPTGARRAREPRLRRVACACRGAGRTGHQGCAAAPGLALHDCRGEQPAGADFGPAQDARRGCGAVIATIPGRGYRFTGEVRAAAPRGRPPRDVAAGGGPARPPAHGHRAALRKHRRRARGGLLLRRTDRRPRHRPDPLREPPRRRPAPRNGPFGAPLAIRPEQAEESAAAAAARYLVCGAVRRSGGRIRVTARLEGGQRRAFGPSASTGRSTTCSRCRRNWRTASPRASPANWTTRGCARSATAAGEPDAYDLCLWGRDMHGRATEADTLWRARCSIGRSRSTRAMPRRMPGRP